jgi:predicted phage tail protein
MREVAETSSVRADDSMRAGEVAKIKRISDFERLEILRQKKAQLEAQIATVESRARIRTRKDDTHLKIIIGAALLAHSAIHPEMRQSMVSMLNKAVTAPRDREFLTRMGMLD